MSRKVIIGLLTLGIAMIVVGLMLVFIGLP
jgi:hypothetical protein